MRRVSVVWGRSDVNDLMEGQQTLACDNDEKSKVSCGQTLFNHMFVPMLTVSRAVRCDFVQSTSQHGTLAAVKVPESIKESLSRPPAARRYRRFRLRRRRRRRRRRKGAFL